MYWIKSDSIISTHGFSMRQGGVSPKPFNSLNLGGSEDLPENIARNREIALAELKIPFEQVAYLNQIHSNIVCEGIAGKQTGDALVTNKRSLALAVGAADCYPVLLEDKKNGVIGAAHCGWKGTLGKIVKHTIEKMIDIGAETHCMKVAIGQGISMKHYEVSEDIISQFKMAGFPDTCWQNRQLNLLAANQFVALEAGIQKTNLWSMNRCTTEEDFFSYRRDQEKTGRMWAIITQ